MNDPVSFPVVDTLGGAEVVLTLFVAACFASFYKKKSSSGLIFFTFASITCLGGILPSKLLVHCIVNKVILSLLCLYLVIIAALQTGCIQAILHFLLKTCRGSSLKFYLLLTALASFFPSRRIQREMISFLRKQDLSSEIPFHFLFPALFVMASSLTLVGSVTNLVSDHICGEILEGRHWGFFAYGPVTFSLFFVCFLFFFYVVKKQTKRIFEKSLAAPILHSKADFQDTMMMENIDPHVLAPSRWDSFKQTENSEQSAIHAGHFPSARRGTLVVFCVLACLTFLGVPLIITSPISAVVLYFFGAFEKKGQLKKLPWDVFLLIVSGFIFCHAIIETKLDVVIAQKLSFLRGQVEILTFFLFAAALFSLFIPSIIVVSFLLPAAVVLGAFHSAKFMQLLIAAVTLGSFFLFPKKSIVSLHFKSSSQEQQLLLRLQLMWILVVYLIFIFHSFLTAAIA